MNIQYVEENPICAVFFEHALPRANKGYKCVPCASSHHDLDCNTSELVEYFKEGVPDESVVGFITAPWCQTLWKNKEIFDKSLRLLKEAKEKFYKLKSSNIICDQNSTWSFLGNMLRLYEELGIMMRARCFCTALFLSGNYCMPCS